MNILVIRLSSMGDVILAAPVFSFLREKHPRAEITFLTGKAYAGLFADDKRLTRVIEFSKTSGASAGLLSDTQWDLVIDLQNSHRSRKIVRSLQTKAQGSFDKLHRKRFRLLFLRADTYDPDLNVATRFRRAAGGTDASPESPVLFFSKEAAQTAQALLARAAGGIIRPAIALFPFSAWKNKEWPGENFITVGKYFLAKGWNVAIMGGPEEAAQADKMRGCIGGRCVSFAGLLSLYECGCLLTGFALALGNDSGLSHLARACGVKVGIIYGPTTRQFGFFPYGDPPYQTFETPLACRPCHAHGGNVCVRFDRRCMTQIGVQRVIRGLEELRVAT
jgi:heptosyltransferase-2